MAPLASDPRQLLVVLNPARRKALLTLLGDITQCMRTQLELPDGNSPGAASAPLFAATRATSSAESVSDPELVRVRAAALAHLDQWAKDVLAEMRELLSASDDAKMVEARRQRAAAAARAADDDDDDADVARLQARYRAIPTRLATLPAADRAEVLSCVLVVLLSRGRYGADARALAVYLTAALALPLRVLVREETEMAKWLVEASTSEEAKPARQEVMSAEAEAQKRREDGKGKRYWKVGLASVAGAAIVGVTGGLAAPVVAGVLGGLMTTLGLGGVASFLGIFWMNSALVGALFGAYGAGMTVGMVSKYEKEVEDFKFLPLQEQFGNGSKPESSDVRRLKVTIGINGWLASPEEVTRPFRSISAESEIFALRYEMESLLALGQAFENLLSAAAFRVLRHEILRRTVLATLMTALWPLSLLNLASNIDNPFNHAKNRSEKAGRVLADALINRVQGERPVTLVGYSLGARVIYSCLRSLAERRAFGLIDTVVLIGAPVPSGRKHWQMMRSVVSGKMFNVYSKDDYILAFMYRAASVQMGVAGLQAIPDIEGVESVDLSAEVKGHLRYPDLMGPILTRCGFPDINAGPIEKEEIDPVDEGDHGTMGNLIDLDFAALSLPDAKAANLSPAVPPRPTMSTSSRAGAEAEHDGSDEEHGDDHHGGK